MYSYIVTCTLFLEGSMPFIYHYYEMDAECKRAKSDVKKKSRLNIPEKVIILFTVLLTTGSIADIP